MHILSHYNTTMPDYLQVLRKNKTPVDTAIAIACGEGVVKSKDANLLAANNGTTTVH